ncbi:hypothetical protein BSZ35_18055 [Salinibacter sp. 10B]|nr:hypothetical protein BSZ35_18055 [Salinibacter sp. 10B]
MVFFEAINSQSGLFLLRFRPTEYQSLALDFDLAVSPTRRALHAHRTASLLAPKATQVSLLQRRFPLLLAEALIGPVESGCLLMDGTLQKLDCLLVEATPLPVGKYLEALLPFVRNARQCDRGHRQTLF